MKNLKSDPRDGNIFTGSSFTAYKQRYFTREDAYKIVQTAAMDVCAK